MEEEHGQRRSWLETVVNVTTLALVVFMGVSMAIAKYTRHDGPADTEHLLQLGAEVPLRDVDWTSAPVTLVFALSTGCHFCSESAPFYSALLASDRTGWNAVGVLPQSLEDAERYTRSLNYSLPQTKRVNLLDLGISATPTLMLVDSKGKLLQQWVGKLSPEEEADVAAHLGIRTWKATPRVVGSSDGAPSPVVTRAELASMLASRGRFNILDVRERGAYRHGSIDSAINIPAAELSVRAPHEIWVDAPTLLYCQFSAACTAAGRPSLCSDAMTQLASAGIGRVRVIRDSIPLLSKGGIPIRGETDKP